MIVRAERLSLRFTPAVSAIASRNASDAGVRSRRRVTQKGPPAPRRPVSPSSRLSIRLKLGRTSSWPQPAQPSAAQSSEFLRLPRTNSIPLIDPEPSSTRPLVCGIFRPSAFSCGPRPVR